jgi:membrane fusion protein (multidrug efflux system)
MMTKLKALRAALTARLGGGGIDRRRVIFITLGVALGLGAAWFIYQHWMYVETDNAYVTGHLYYVSPRITGVAQSIEVRDNQRVKQGDLLLTLDPADYRAAYNEEKANTDKARTDFEMVSQLAGTKAVSDQEMEHAANDLAAAEARLQSVKLQLDYTALRAPADGVVGRKNVEPGNRVQPGQTLMVIVSNELWVVANFKETQLPGMKIGQTVELDVDAIPGKSFSGRVESFSPASGNQFALLPADNSTGNFTKIVQRVPVKIVFDADSIKGYEDRIRAGLSVVVKVKKH